MLNGADVTVVDARNRVGGTYWLYAIPWSTARRSKPAANIIDEGHREGQVRPRLRLKLVPILRGGFSLLS